MKWPWSKKRDRGYYIWCYSGRLFYPLDPHPEEVCIEDIAKGLSNECRFSGQTDYYSVAEHSLLISQCAEKTARDRGCTDEEVYSASLWGLLHDATEAYIGDIVRPLKYTSTFAGYREAERKLEVIIREHFSPWLAVSSYIEDLVRKLDTRILADEAEQLILRPDKTYIEENFGKPLGVNINCWLPHKAEELFLKRFWELVPGYPDISYETYTR